MLDGFVNAKEIDFTIEENKKKLEAAFAQVESWAARSR